MYKHLSCTLSRLSSSESGAIVRVSERLSGLHPIHLHWFRTRMTDVPFAAVSGDTSATSTFLQALLRPAIGLGTLHSHVRCWRVRGSVAKETNPTLVTPHRTWPDSEHFRRTIQKRWDATSARNRGDVASEARTKGRFRE